MEALWKVRILFINRYFYPDHSATSQMLSDLAFELAGSGSVVHVIASRLRYDAAEGDLPAAEMIKGVDVHRVWTSRFGRHFLPGRALDYLTFYASAGWCLFRLVQSGDVVVAKTDPPLISVMAAWVVKRRGARLVNWVQDLFPEVAIVLGVKGFNGWLGRFLVRKRNISLQRAYMNVVIGERMRERLLKEGIDEGRLKVIHNWANEEGVRFVSAQEDNPLRQEWGLAGKFVIGYSGNLGRAHEVETLLGAAQQLKDIKDIVFLFIGGGALRKRVEKEAAKRGLINLMFKGYQPRKYLSESLGVADVHVVVLKPQMEGLIVPSKFYGIAAAGRPTLFIGDVGGEIGQILNSGETGFALMAGDVDTFVGHVLNMKDDRKKLLSMGASARQLFEARFSKTRAMSEWRQLLQADSLLIGPRT